MGELNPTSKKRLEELDIVKGIAILYVFIRHLCELTGANVYGADFLILFQRGGEYVIILFILLSGYVFKSKGSIWLDIKNKVKQLLVPYLLFVSFFTVTYFIRYVLIDKMDILLFIRNTISNYLAARNLDIPALGSGLNIMKYAVVPYWYITALFTSYILFIIIYRFVENRKVYIRIIAATILLTTTCLLMYFDIGGVLRDLYESGFSYFTIPVNVVGFAGLLMIGTILRQYKIFDIEAHSKRFTTILFAFCLVNTVIQFVIYDNQYALQYGKWGQYHIWSVFVTTFTGFTLAYSLIYLSYYLKRIKLIKTILSFLGAKTLDIYLLHFGIGELICMILGFWYPVYDISVYPSEGYAWWHPVLVIILTGLCMAGYFAAKKIYLFIKLKR